MTRWYPSAAGSRAQRPSRPRLQQPSLPGVVEREVWWVDLGLEGFADQRGVLRAWDVVQVLHRRLDVRVAHPVLYSTDVGDADDARAEGVAEVVEAQATEGCSV